jgi:glycosyltransferase involved in cell wall biosynthesis
MQRKTSMIIAKIIGGLGNQIAQYAFGLTCARRLRVPLKLDLTGYQSYNLHHYGLDRFTLEAEEASHEEILLAKSCAIVQEKGILFEPGLLDQVRDHCYLDGYWSDYRYSADLMPHLRTHFHPKENLLPQTLALIESMARTESVSLHIRRGDYVTNPNCVVMPMTYYEDALKLVSERIPNAHVYIFSDDMPWVEAHLVTAIPHTFVRDNDASRNIEDFQLMRRCKHHIVANSTFSSWAATLGAEPGMVIAPQQFFRPDDPWMLSTFGKVEQPVWTTGWITMPVRLADAPPALDFPTIVGGHNAGRRMRIGVWNYYEELTTNGFLFRNTNAPIGHDLLKPWADLHAYGRVHGMDFVTLDQTSGPHELDAVLFMDRPRSDSHIVAQIMATDIPKYFCIFETELIKPDNWDVNFHAQFDRIFTWSDVHVDDRKYFKLNFSIDPYTPYDFEVLKSAFRQRKLCTLIASAKFSNHPNELYSARIDAIQWFERHAPSEFDLYGQGWDVKNFPSYRGVVQDKLSALARYRFAICFENAKNYPGYVTEKILDCFRAGVIPIYLGAPNIEDIIPKECFIDRRKFSNNASLYDYILNMDADQYNKYINEIHKFLNSPKIYPFSIECSITTLTSYIARDIKKRRNASPTLTVAIPTYNYGKYLHLAIGSAFTQNIENLEVLVLDNASNDETPTAISSFIPNLKFRYMRNSRNFGAQTNWRNAELVSCGEFFTILSADDFLLPGQLHRMQDVMQKNEHISLAYCPVMLIDEKNQAMDVLNHAGHMGKNYIGGRDELVNLLTHDCYITPSAAVIRRTDFDLAGRMDSSLNGAIDWDMWIRISEINSNFAFFKDALVCYRVHPEQDTNRQNSEAKLLADHIKILKKVLKQGSLSGMEKHYPQIINLLRHKFNSYPFELVDDLRSDFLELESKLRT